MYRQKIHTICVCVWGGRYSLLSLQQFKHPLFLALVGSGGLTVQYMWKIYILGRDKLLKKKVTLLDVLLDVREVFGVCDSGMTNTFVFVEMIVIKTRWGHQQNSLYIKFILHCYIPIRPLRFEVHATHGEGFIFNCNNIIDFASGKEMHNLGR